MNKSKTNQKKFSFMLLIAIYASGLLMQFVKNVTTAHHFQGISLTFAATTLFLIILLLVAFLTKIKVWFFGRYTEVFIITFEIILTLLAIFCYCCLDDSYHLVTSDKVNSQYAVKCCFNTVGIVGGFVSGVFLPKGIEYELSKNNKEKVLKFRNFKSNRLERTLKKANQRGRK
jgi:hypothetical protein